MAVATVPFAPALDFQQLDSLSNAQHVLTRAKMEACFGPLRATQMLTSAANYLQKQMDSLTAPVFDDPEVF